MAKNTLEDLNGDSLVVVHRSGSDLIDKTAKQDTQGIKVSKLNFEEVFENSTQSVPEAKGAQNYPNAKAGQSILIRNTNASGGAKRFVCVGSYGTSIPWNMNIPASRVTTQPTALDNQSGFQLLSLTGSSPAVGKITHSSGLGDGLKLSYKASGNEITDLVVSYSGVNFKAGDTLTLTDLPGQVGDIIITLTDDEVNHGIWVFEAFGNNEASTPGGWAQ